MRLQYFASIPDTKPVFGVGMGFSIGGGIDNFGTNLGVQMKPSSPRGDLETFLRESRESVPLVAKGA